SSICVASFSMPPLPTYSSTLSLHDALPISPLLAQQQRNDGGQAAACGIAHEDDLGCALQPGPARILEQQPRRSQAVLQARREGRSEEHTSALQSRENLVCRLLLEKKKQKHH